MTQSHGRNWLRACLVSVAGLGFLISVAPQPARGADQTDIRVVVKDAESNEPIYQAHLTLQFQEVRKLKRDKWIAFSAKTDKQGLCRFRHIPKGPVRLIVTADHHQSFGKEYEIEEENPLIEVKLRKPQPLL